MTVGKRVFKKAAFLTGTTDDTVVIPVSDSAGAGLVAVYSRKTGGAGSANLTVSGAFVSEPTADDLFQIQAPTSVGTGALTNILGTSEDHRFPYIVLFLDRTGSISVDVFVSVF